MCTPAGWAGEARLAYSWPDAEAKARAALAFLRRRADEAGVAVAEWHEEYFGVNAYAGSAVGRDEACEPPEVIGRLAWRTADPESAGRVSREVGVLGLSGPPTISGFGRGRDGRPTQLLAVEPFYVDKGLVDSQVRVEVEEV